MSIFAIVIFMFVFVDNGETEDEPDEISAYVFAEKTIKPRLKAPSTAEFASFNNSEITRDRDTFYVRSYVDSQNGFGAMVRSNFEVRVFFKDGKAKTRILHFE